MGAGLGGALVALEHRVSGYLENASEHVSVAVQIETAAGVEAAAEIAAVDWVNGVFVGPADLGASMGLLGQQAHPEVMAAVHEVFRAVKKVEKPVGVKAFDPVMARGYMKDGVDFIAVRADVTLLARGPEGWRRSSCLMPEATAAKPLSAN